MTSSERNSRIAIVGVGGIFPGALNLDQFWQNISLGIDSGRHVPPGRWYLNAETAFDAQISAPDRVYSDWGCFIEGFSFDSSELELDQAYLTQLDPAFLLALHAARAAFRDADRLCKTDLRRVGVILGNIALPTESTSAMCRDVLRKTLIERINQSIRTNAENSASSFPNQIPVPADGNWHPDNHYAASLPAVLIAKGLKLGGSAYTLDAACASSLYALKFACEELKSYRADAMFAGGMSRPDCQYTQMGFAQLKALSRCGRCAPLSAAADGLVVGEGAGVFVLKRLEDALAADDHIYGIIAGIGLSNDRGANLLAPHSEGQLRAMQAAYQEAGWQPDDVDLIECHATGTPVGDGVEISSLHQLWQGIPAQPGQCVIGGVKSNVGHLLTGAGAAGLMKVLFAIKHQTLPPTANYESPPKGIQHESSPFRVLQHAEPWIQRSQGSTSSTRIPRRATVNAFGFGGINAHVLIEEHIPDSDDSSSLTDHGRKLTTRLPPATSSADLQIAVVGMAVQIGEYHSLNTASRRLLTEAFQAGIRETNDWGVRSSEWYANQYSTQELSGPPRIIPAIAVTEVQMPLGQFRIPPLEMQDMLPQQQLMLKVAAEALRDARPTAERSGQSKTLNSSPVPSNETVNNRTGVFIGIELDPNTTQFHLRWSIEQDAPKWAERLALDLTPDELTRWISDLKTTISPPLTANRVMGNLGGIVASRLAREFEVGGPSFTISSDQNSGLRAFELATHALQRKELDRAVVGAVDLPCDIRSQIARQRINRPESTSPICDGAVAFVLKRLEDAVNDGDQIHAVVSKFESSEVNSANPTSLIDDDAGAATGALALARAVEILKEKVIDTPHPQYWLTNRGDGPRRIQISGRGIDGRNLAIELSEPAESQRLPNINLVDHVPHGSGQTSAAIHAALFVVDGDSVEQIAVGLEQLLQLTTAASHSDSLGTRQNAGTADDTRNNRSHSSNLWRRHPQTHAMAYTVDQLAKQWYRKRRPNAGHQLAMTLVTKSLDELIDLIHFGQTKLEQKAPIHNLDRRIYFSRTPLGIKGQLGFVFPGSGNAFLGMGRELLATFPTVLDQQERENTRLRDQYRPDLIWNGHSTSALLEDHKAMIFGQVAIGTAICDLLSLFQIHPNASIGYSLGESAALFGLRAWTERDEMLRRMDAATLFGSDLVKPFNAARRAWNRPSGEELSWITGVVDRPTDVVREAISRQHSEDFSREPTGDHPQQPQLFLLIINSPTQCVIGGVKEHVDRLVDDLDAKFVSFLAPSSVHCEILRQVEPAYRALHLMKTRHPFTTRYSDTLQTLKSVTTPELNSSQSNRIEFYSTAWGRSYELTPDSAADAIVAQAVATIDFPAVIQQAYKDGVRIFLEIGPGSSCTRMISEILAGQPHVAQSALPLTGDSIGAFFEVLAMLIAERIPVDLSQLYGEAVHPPKHLEINSHQIATKVGGTSFVPPLPVSGWRFKPMQIPAPTPEVPKQPASAGPIGTNVIHQLQEIIEASLKSHEAYLKVSAEIQRLTEQQLSVLGRLADSEIASIDSTRSPLSASVAKPMREAKGQDSTGPGTSTIFPPRSLSRVQCMEFAIGQIGKVLGPKFAAIDQHPTRVRLPDEPLMLVDRILEIEGEPLSMTSGRVVTEHDIHSDAWYLDCDRIPTCIAVEAGQADLFLSGWLGIDFETHGLACYRLLDAVVTFHRELPRPGQTIHYDIRINHFFRQGQTYLFRFEFDATVNGEPLLTMREGCAGFFTEAELAGGKGVVHTALDKQPRPGKRPDDWINLTAMTVESYDDTRLNALRRGELANCFGPEFIGLDMTNPVTLPGLAMTSPPSASSRTRMWLVDRVLKLDPTAGKYGLGSILAELDIHPDDWFITSHFCDDQVMPGTLMYECCLHTLRIFLLRMGWIGETGQVAYEPVPGVRSRLKCRGQVLATTKKVWYEIAIKEVGYSLANESHQASADQTTADRSVGPLGTPYCLADALMYADGKPIVEITDMSVRLTGLLRDTVERLWSQRKTEQSSMGPKSIQSSVGEHPQRPYGDENVRYDRRPAIFDTDRITAFAVGKPSDAFGDRYRAFDSERIIARLPGPPFQFLDRVVSITGCEPWVLKSGGEIVAQYDIPGDAWYFSANRQNNMPFAILLETALQPCGWLAGYVGSALTSETDLSFRNLGGTATQFQEVTRNSGTLTTRVKMTAVSNSGGMIIQHYDFEMQCNGNKIYAGNTYFGFFSRASLANQIGIRDAKPFMPDSKDRSHARQFPYVDASPFANSQLQMIDDVQLSLQDGPFNWGFAIGTTAVNPASWFFKAHFYQDPVVPGSLGLESFMQLLKLYAAERWNLTSGAQFVTPLLADPIDTAKSRHEWVYRGQIIPADQKVTVSAVIKHVDDNRRELLAEGFLSVDGRIIYQMKNFSLGCP